MSTLEFTGERYVPGVRGEIWIEHWHRYHFAAPWAAGKRVLDIACGEGYGSALLAQKAAAVTGVDVSPQAIAHAQQAYRDIPNLRFVQGSCTAIPLAQASVDLVVSFETLEHIAEQERFLDEVTRVLAPGGMLVLSCPNKTEYTDKRGYRNEFHVKEPYREELAALVSARFPAIRWHGQRPTFFSVIAPEGPATAAQLVEVEESNPGHAAHRMSAPLYFLLVASRDAAALESLPQLQSVLVDRGDWAYKDWEQSIRAWRASDARVKELEAELERRRGLGWWLRLPLVRLGLLK